MMNGRNWLVPHEVTKDERCDSRILEIECDCLAYSYSVMKIYDTIRKIICKRSLTDQYPFRECRVACPQKCTMQAGTYRRISETAVLKKNILETLGAKKVSFEFRSGNSGRQIFIFQVCWEWVACAVVCLYNSALFNPPASIHIENCGDWKDSLLEFSRIATAPRHIIAIYLSGINEGQCKGWGTNPYSK